MPTVLTNFYEKQQSNKQTIFYNTCWKERKSVSVNPHCPTDKLSCENYYRNILEKLRNWIENFLSYSM